MEIEVGTLGTVTDVRRDVAFNISAYGEPTHGWRVRLLRPNGDTWHLSQLDNEPVTRWVKDAEFLANGYPVHSNGFGARYLMTAELTDEKAEALNKALREAPIEWRRDYYREGGVQA